MSAASTTRCRSTVRLGPTSGTIFDFSGRGYLSSRGLSIGHVLSQDGTHVATIAQEVYAAEGRSRLNHAGIDVEVSFATLRACATARKAAPSRVGGSGGASAPTPPAGCSPMRMHAGFGRAGAGV